MLTVYGPNDQQLHVEAGTTIGRCLSVRNIGVRP